MERDANSWTVASLVERAQASRVASQYIVLYYWIFALVALTLHGATVIFFRIVPWPTEGMNAVLINLLLVVPAVLFICWLAMKGSVASCLQEVGGKHMELVRLHADRVEGLEKTFDQKCWEHLTCLCEIGVPAEPFVLDIPDREVGRGLTYGEIRWMDEKDETERERKKDEAKEVVAFLRKVGHPVIVEIDKIDAMIVEEHAE